MSFLVKEHGGITPETFERPFFLRHLAAYKFSKRFVEGKKVLEIGFGDGYGSFYLAPHTKSMSAIDLFKKNVMAAREKYKSEKLDFYAMDACNLEFGDQIFDIAIAFQLIEHIPRDTHDAFLREVGRVLKDDGKFIVTTPNVVNLRKNANTYTKNPHHDLEFTCEALRDLLGKHFEEVDMRVVDYSRKYKFFLTLKKSGIFKYLPGSFDIANKYFQNMSEEDFIVKPANIKKAPDILAICSMPRFMPN